MTILSCVSCIDHELILEALFGTDAWNVASVANIASEVSAS